MDANHSLGHPRFIIDAAALKTNLRTLRRHLAAEVNLCAVLKADAYGHGAALVAQAIAAAEAESPFLRVDQFAVATFDEAEELAEFDKPIMLLRPVENAFIGRQREQIEQAIKSGWTLTLASAAAADDIARIALHVHKRANVQIMLDTGMTRCGVQPADFGQVVERTLHHAALRLTAVSTHLVNSEVAGDAFTNRQLRQFKQAVDEYPIIESARLHAANSGAIFFTPRAHFDVVRPGIALYGVDPTGRACTNRALAPIGRLMAPIIAIHEIEAGQSVGYGQTWIAADRTRVAIIPIGYADGYPRSASNRAVMMLGDKVCGVLGRVSMDMCAINITSVPEPIIGDEVTVIDNNPFSPASVYQLARVCDTIPYEILTGIGRRVKRVLVNAEVESPADVDAER
ncbi:MAG: alanine racemase [Burkholderiales bacterium]|nr:alanine racemase [Phycisphaerae bacterium]